MKHQVPPMSLFDTLVAAHGYLIGGTSLWRLLAYNSAEAFKKAQQRGSVPVPLARIPGRRTKFAKTADVAAWLEKQPGRRLAKARCALPARAQNLIECVSFVLECDDNLYYHRKASSLILRLSDPEN